MAELREERSAPETRHPVGLRKEVVRREVVPVAPSVNSLQLAVEGREKNYELGLRDLRKVTS